MSDARLRSVPFFTDLDEADLERISAATSHRDLPVGGRLFEEGDEAAAAYVIVAGELEILKKSSDREILLAVRGPGDVIGEMSLLEDAPRMAGAKARTEVELLEIPRAVFDEVLSTSTAASRRLFGVLLERWRETESRLRQREQLAQLGTLSAGLAHELNNPAAAAKRAVAGFEAAAGRLAAATATLERFGAGDEVLTVVEQMAAAEPQRLGSLARGDREEALMAQLKALGVERPAAIAATLVDADGSAVDRALRVLGGMDAPEVTAAVIGVAAARREIA